MSVTERLAAEVAGAEFDGLPPGAVGIVKRALMDDIGVALLAHEYLDQPLIGFARQVGGLPEATLLGDGGRVSAGLAAGVNAEMASHSDFEESGPGVHAFSPIGQTAVAMAERTGGSGRDVIAAIAVSYELNGRFARNLADTRPLIHLFPAHFRRHLIVNPALVAARMLGLDAAATNIVIGLAWTMVPPDMNHIYLTPRLGWPNSQHNLWSCQIGVQAALLVAAGSGGPPDILDHGASDIYSLDSLGASPTPWYYLTHELNFKPWIGSYGFMGAMQLADRLVTRHRIDPSSIDEVVFRGSAVYNDPDSVFIDPEPDTAWAALGCVPWAISNVILGHPAGPDWLAPGSLVDPIRRSLARRVRLETSESPYVNEVAIRAGGRTYRDRIRREDYLGSPRNPMSPEQLEAKFLRNASVAVGESRAQEMLVLLRSLEELDDIRRLTRYYSPSR